MSGILAPSDDFKRFLSSLERKLQVVRDHVTAVAKGVKTGFFLHGPGGAGKSYTVLRHLEHLQACYQLYNSRMTAKGLFQSLQRAPDAVHVLEDMERLTKDADAQGDRLKNTLTMPHPLLVKGGKQINMIGNLFSLLF